MIRDEHLEILGLNKNATLADVTQAHRDLSRVWHPDRFGQDERLRKIAEEKMKQVNAAYEYLKNDSWLASEENTKKSETNTRFDGGEEFTEPFEKTDLQLLIPSSGVLLNMIFLSIIGGLFFGNSIKSCIAPPAQTVKTFTPASSDVEKIVVAELTAPVVTTEVEPDLANQSAETAIEQRIVPASLLQELNDPNEIPSVILPEQPRKERDKLYRLVKNQKVREEYINSTPDIVEAAIKCDLERSKNLLAEGADPNEKDERGDSALTWAVKRRCLTVSKLLLEKGADVNLASNNGFTPYVWARTYGSEEIRTLLEEKGAKSEAGAYWWRNSADGQIAWLNQSLEYVCKSDKCPGKKSR